MKNITARILLFVIAIPALVVLVLILPGYSHLGLNIAVVLAAGVAGAELAEMFRHRGIHVNSIQAFITAAVVPAAAYAEMALRAPSATTAYAMAAGIAAAAVPQLVPKQAEHFDRALPEFAGSALVVLYPGLLAAFIVRISALNAPSVAYLTFLMTVFANDTAAYVFGMLFGRRSRGVVAVSPHKSAVGFAAGVAFSLITALVFYRLAPQVFSSRIWAAVAVGAALGGTTIVGDLVESALKRSADVKDSGTVIPGRGGVLDSVDSILLGAPVFVAILQLAAA